ncbi:MAG TPA: tetratricopeptide repeat protein [Gemmatimonadaceae bacterium]|nr:tetratricopeptide repeat protein [Gemmatimonadaceae bacterium]
MDSDADLLTVARERFAARDYRGAALLLASAIESGQGYADAHHLLGLCYAMLESRDQALQAFDGALKLNPRYVEAHLNRAIVLSDLGRRDEAEQALSRAQELGRPDDTGFPAVVANRLANMHAELANAYREAGSYRAAADQYRTGLALRPAFADLRVELARTLLDGGEPATAADELDIVLRDHPDWLEAMLLRGLAAYLAGHLDQAKSVWERASERHPEEPRLETYRSMLARRLGEQS